MNEDKKFFDVGKSAGPQPTSKPIIVGHHPQMPDPMIREGMPKPPNHIDLSPKGDNLAPPPQNVPGSTFGPASGPVADPFFASSGSVPALNEVQSLPPTARMPADSGRSGANEELHVPAGHPAYGHKPRVWVWLLLTLLVLFAAYAAIDAKSDILPVHIFSHTKTNTAAVTDNSTSSSQSSPSTTNQTAVLAGFTKYQPKGTPVVFQYPTAWGTANTTNDPGFSKRGGTNKTDGVHAYLVNFSTNKDVQVAITASKYLPAARDAQYYDYLQWCYGVPDGKFYKQRLMFTTTNGVDTPSNATCDQGPLADAVPLSKDKTNAVIIQDKTKDPKGKVIGDLYTANLSDANLPVLRIKDTKMTSAADIKKLISTITGASSTSQ